MDHTEDMMDQGVSGALPQAAGLSQAEPEVSALRASIPNAAHTPGPWFAEGVRYARDFRAWQNVIATDGRFVAAVSCDPSHYTAELEANVAVVSAATDLLDALKALVTKSTDTAGDWSNEWRAALDAIAKAEGR